MLSKKSMSLFLSISWFVLSLLVGVMNDSIIKHLSVDFEITQLVFIRCLLSAITLLPIIFYTGVSKLKTKYLFVHIVRSILLFGAIILWSISLKYIPIMIVTAVGFTMPLYVLILSRFFLKEKFNIPRIIATIIGFLGVIYILPLNQPAPYSYSALIFLFVACLCFASLDIINKKFISSESILSMMFYSALITTFLGGLGTSFSFKMPSLYDLLLLFLLGGGANLLLYFLLRAFQGADASFLSPFRYMELIFSTFVGYCFFKEAISLRILLGGAVILFATIFVTYFELADSRKNLRLQILKKYFSLRKE